MKTENNIYFLELTDTFGGEANYLWVRRYKIIAASEKQALTKFKREYFGIGHNQRHKIEYDTGDVTGYKFSGNCIIAFLMYFEIGRHDKYFTNLIEL